MDTYHAGELISSGDLNSNVPEHVIAQLVGQVYETAPAAARSRLLEQLLRPLGVLALVALANGVFAKIRFRGGWPDIHVRLEDAQNVQVSDVIALVDYVQQVSVQAVDGLAQVLAATPTMATSAATVLLVTVLMQRSRNRRADDNGINSLPKAPI